MNQKQIKSIITSQKVNMGGHILDQPLPIGGLDYVDPFLLIHHWEKDIPKDSRQQELGVGPHPHRGFSPVTFVFKGSVHHQDSLGNQVTVETGGTQWMHAGKGITHSERPGKELANEGGEHEFIQFWVNTPSRHKMDAPYYKPISYEETPRIEEKGFTIDVVCGEYKGVKGAVSAHSPLILLRGEIKSQGVGQLSIPSYFNCLLYLLDGQITVQGQEVNGRQMVYFGNEGEEIHLSGVEHARYILLSGQPLEEEVSTYGPFVMTNQTEIMQALQDAQTGKMGVLIEEF